MIDEFIDFFNQYGLAVLNSQYLNSRDTFRTPSHEEVDVDDWREDVSEVVEIGLERLDMGKTDRVSSGSYDQLYSYNSYDSDQRFAQLDRDDDYRGGTEWKLTVFPLEDQSGQRMVRVAKDSYGNIELTFYNNRHPKNVTVRINPSNPRENCAF